MKRVLSEKKRLGLWHRTRVVQVRRGTPLGNLFHVRTNLNVADLEEMVADGDLTPVEQLVLQKEDKQDYEDGFVFERTPDVLTQGHTTLTANRADLVAKRVEFSEYLNT